MSQTNLTVMSAKERCARKGIRLWITAVSSEQCLNQSNLPYTHGLPSSLFSRTGTEKENVIYIQAAVTSVYAFCSPHKRDAILRKVGTLITSSSALK